MDAEVRPAGPEKRKYLFNLVPLWDEPYVKPIMGGCKYVRKVFSRLYPLHLHFSADDWADIMSAAFARGYAVWQATGDEHSTFVAARFGAENELRALLRPHSWMLRLHEAAMEKEELPLIPILPIARLLYKKLKKKGARGRKSAVVKAYILQQKMQGKPLHRIFLELETTKNYALTFDNVRRHYQSACALIFDIRRGNITR